MRIHFYNAILTDIWIATSMWLFIHEHWVCGSFAAALAILHQSTSKIRDNQS